MNDERLHVVETNRNGQETFLFILGGKQFATVRHRRFRSRVFFVRSCPTLEIDPPPAGQCWTLPLREIMVAIADVRKRLRLRNEEGGTQYIVSDPRLVDRHVVLTIRLGDDLDAVIHKSGYRKQVRFPPKKTRRKHCLVPLHDAASALCDALRNLYSAERRTIADAEREDFRIVPVNAKVDVLVMGANWIEATRRGRTGLWMKVFERSDFRPWNLPYNTVVTVLAEVRNQLTNRVEGKAHGTEREASRTQAIDLYVMSSSDREWVTVGIAIAAGHGRPHWAELHQEGPELQITIYPRGDGRCWEMPLTHALERLRAAKAMLIGDAERPAVRRPIVAGLGCGRAMFDTDDAESAIFDMQPAARGFTVRRGGREFATVVHGSPPLLEVNLDGRDWTLPLVATMGVLEEALTRVGLEEDGTGHGRHMVLCTEATEQEAVVDIRFNSGLRLEMRRRRDEMLVHIRGGDSDVATRGLPLSEALATLRWGLAMLRAAGPRSPTEATFGDFSAVPRPNGEDVLVAGERWVGVTAESGTEPGMELFGRADLRPWKLPYDAVVAMLVDVRRRLSGDDQPGGATFSGRESLSGRKGDLDHWIAIPSDRESHVVIFRFRDEDCWVQWAELNEEGPELQLEMYRWPGRRMSGFPLREVIDRLRHGKTLLSRPPRLKEWR